MGVDPNEILKNADFPHHFRQKKECVLLLFSFKIISDGFVAFARHVLRCRTKCFYPRTTSDWPDNLLFTMLFGVRKGQQNQYQIIIFFFFLFLIKPNNYFQYL